MTRRTIIAGLAGMIAATTAPASETMTGNGLHSICQDEPAACLGYAMGVRDGITVSVVGGAGCWPKRGLHFVSGIQMRDVIVKYLEDHPQVRHQPAEVLIITALRDAWPCEGE